MRAAICAPEGDVSVRAHYDSRGDISKAVQYALLHPLTTGPSRRVGVNALEGKTIHIPDVLADPEYRAIDYQASRFGVRPHLEYRYLRGGTPIGAFFAARAMR